jgi:uncharacterized membrane protein YdcZ (DUF606 family)
MNGGSKMLQNRNIATLTVGLLGAAKLVLDSFGWNVITDDQINSIANGVAALVTIAGVVMSHHNSPRQKE